MKRNEPSTYENHGNVKSIGPSERNPLEKAIYAIKFQLCNILEKLKLETVERLVVARDLGWRDAGRGDLAEHRGHLE